MIKLLEHEGKALLSACGIAVPEGGLYRALPPGLDGPLVVKAQVFSGGRGKAGGIRFAGSRDEALRIAAEIGAQPLGPARVEDVYIERRLDIVREYYLAALVVRLAAGAWVIWEINFEIRQGTLSYRLLRPIHPLVGWAASNVGTMPMRWLITLPIVAGGVLAAGPEHFTHDPLLLAMFPVAVMGGWAITFLAMAVIGSFAFRIDNSTALFEIWLGLYMLLSGYLLPLEFFPGWLAGAASWLPFRYMLAFPVELAVGLLTRADALRLLGLQAAWIAGLGVAAAVSWRAGVRRFGAFGG